MTSTKPPQKARNKLSANNIKCKLEMWESIVHYTTGLLIEEDRAKDMPKCLNCFLGIWHAVVIYITK